MENIIKIDKLGYNYGEGWILHDLSVEIVQGDFVAVIGPNGAGKSTLLRLLAGILQPTAGTIELYGAPAPQFGVGKSWAMCRRTLPSSTAIFRSVLKKSLSWGCYAAAACFKKFLVVAKSSVETVLERFYLQELAHRKIGELSGGQQQRVFLARAMVRPARTFAAGRTGNGSGPRR